MGPQEIALWAIRVCLAFYLSRVTLQLIRREEVPSKRTLFLWCGGCLFFLIHVAYSMAGFHQWSHAEAVAFTADETYRVTGIRRGEGIWANYLMGLLWMADCLRLVRARVKERPTSPRVDRLIAFFFAVMFFFATVVFGPPAYILVFLVTACIWSVIIARHLNDRIR